MILKTITLYLSSFAFLLPWQPGPVQNPKITPLHLFFQINYDSTIIYHNGSSWYNHPNYLILAKQKGTYYFFTYNSPYRGQFGRQFPGNLVKKFTLEEYKFQRISPDTNQYLLPRRISTQMLKPAWQSLPPRLLWTIKEDKEFKSSDCIIDDGEEHTFFLITKAAIKTARFDEPEYKEQCEGKNTYRQLAIKAIKTMRGVLKMELE